MPSSIYDFTVTAQDGTERSLVDFKGKVLLIVNTATGCGFTPQYVGLQELYETYHDRGFEILDFPATSLATRRRAAMQRSTSSAWAASR